MVSSTSGSNGSGSAARVGDGALRTGYLLGGSGDGAEPPRTRRRRGGRRKLPEQGGGSDPRVSQQQETGRPPLPCTAFDVAYFNSYAHVGIHEEMIKDRTRTDTYKNAIFQHRDQIAGKVVLDVGCGTGILSIFCAQAGARRVYAVDASNIAIQAKEVIKANNLSGTVIVLHGRVEDVKIDEKVDVIVSEWMGYMLLYESMLGSVITARDRWLKPGGLILPSYATLYMAPISYPERYNESVDFWRNVYGIDMSAIMPVAKQCAFEEPSVEMISAENVLTWPCVVKHVDCSTLKIDELETVSTIFRVKSMMRAPFHGFAFWFDVEFGGPSKNSTKSIAEPADAEGPVDMVTEGDKPKKEGPVDTVTEGDKPEKEGPVDTVAEGDKPKKEGLIDTVAEGDKPEKEGPVDTVAEGDKPGKEGPVDTVAEGDKPEKEGPVDTVAEGDKPEKEGPVDTVAEGDKPEKEGPVDTVAEGDKPKKEGPVDTVTEGDKPMKEGPVDTVTEGDKPMKEGPVDTVTEGDKPMKEGPVDTVTEGDRPKKRAKLSEGLVLSTAPEAPPTHWQQTMIYFFDPIEVEQDQVIEGSVTLTQSKENARYMNVHIAYSTGGRSYVKESVLR